MVIKPKPTPNPALKEFWKAKRNVVGELIRYRVLYGGRASSKSWDAAGFAVHLANHYKLRIVCARQFQNKISESVYTLLKTQIERYGLQDRFEIQRNKIFNRVTGAEFLFYGLWRSIDEVKSLEGIDILWLEEAHNLLESQWEILIPTIRKEGSQIWVVFNPKYRTDFVYKRLVTTPPKGCLGRMINYDENPFLSRTMREEIENAKAEDPEKFEHIYLGVPLSDEEGAVIKHSWIMAAVDAHIKLGFGPGGKKRMGFDIADDGDDKCATALAHGSVVLWADMWKAKEDELMKSCKRTYREAIARGAHVIYDSIGVGASAGSKMQELNDENGTRVQYSKFNAGAAVFKPEAKYDGKTKNKDMFANIKAQAWWLLADRFRNTYAAVTNGEKFDEADMISLSSRLPFIELLIEELSTPKRDFDGAGRVKVESKKDLAKREVASPNLADALVMAFAPGSEAMQISDELLGKVRQ